jgi:hypothetical protein
MEAMAQGRHVAAVSGSGRFHAQPVLVPVPTETTEPEPDPVARAGDVRCACCERTPLVGEMATLHTGEGGDAWTCELCERSARRVAPLGDPKARVRVLPPLTGADLYKAA